MSGEGSRRKIIMRTPTKGKRSEDRRKKVRVDRKLKPGLERIRQRGSNVFTQITPILIKRAPGMMTRVEGKDRSTTNQTDGDENGGAVRGTAMRLAISSWDDRSLRKVCTKTRKGFCWLRGRGSGWSIRG